MHLFPAWDILTLIHVHGLPQVVDAFQVRKDLPGVGEEVGEDVVGVPRALQHVREEDVEVGGEVLHVHAELAKRHIRLQMRKEILGRPSDYFRGYLPPWMELEGDFPTE